MSGAEYNMPDIIQNPLDASPALAPPSEGGYWTGNAHPSHMVSLASVLKSGADVIDEIHFAQDNTLSGSLHDIFLGHQLSTGSNGDIGQKKYPQRTAEKNGAAPCDTAPAPPKRFCRRGSVAEERAEECLRRLR